MAKQRIKLEEAARRILERETGLSVVTNDDGRLPSMYDLRIGLPSAPLIAVECTGAVDRKRTQTWNIGPAKGPLSLDLHGDWHVVLRPHARVKQIRQRIESVLQQCEQTSIDGFTPVDWHLKRRNLEVCEALSELNITSINCFRPDGSGAVHLGMMGFGGAVDSEGGAVPGWVGEFLRDSERTDVLAKLEASGAQECHVFVAVSFGGVPWPVESYLGTQTESLPIAAPDLPSPVTAVWIMYGARGVRWHGDKWTFFNATIPSDSLS